MTEKNSPLLNTPAAIVLAGLLIAIAYYVSSNGLTWPQSGGQTKPAANQQTANSAPQGPVRDLFVGYAQSLGLETGKFGSCLDSKKYQDEIQASLAKGQELGVNGTPTFFVNGRRFSGAHDFTVFQEFIDKELAKQGSQDINDYSSAIQQINENNPGIFEFRPVDVEVGDDDPMLGSKDASVTLVDYSDYQCPFCGRFFNQTLPAIKSEYIETGKIRYIIKDFPLSFHPNAQGAALAARCAGDQGAYWEMHDLLFENQDEWSNAQPL